MTHGTASVGARAVASDRVRFVLALSVASGCVSLGYQVMWFRVLADRFGSTGLTFLLVLVAFIAGLGIGSLASGRILERARRTRWLHDPVALVGALELLIAVTAPALRLIGKGSAAWNGPFPYALDGAGVCQPTLATSLVAALAIASMVAPTFLMGTTFPLLCRAFARRAGFPAQLYGWNTFGACGGVLLAEFVLLPAFGQEDALPLLAVANLFVGAGFLLVARGRAATAGEGAPRAADPARSSDASPAVAGAPATSVLVALAALSGFLSGALEVDLFRAVRFARAFTDAALSFTSFWAIVAIFAASFTVRRLGRPRPALLRFALVGTLVLHALTWSFLFEIRKAFGDAWLEWARAHLGAPPDATIFPLSASLGLLLAFTGALIFPAYFCASLLLPTVCNAAQAGGRPLGRIYGWNTLAFCAGAVLFTAAAPRVDLFYSVKLLLAVLAIGAALAFALRLDRPPPRRAFAFAAAAALAAVFVVPHGFDRSFFRADEPPALFPVTALRSNGVDTTYVVAHPEGKILYFNSHPMSGTRATSLRYMRLMAHVPLLAQQDPERALLICFGVGNTARAIASHESVRAIDVVDLNDQVFATADEFRATNLGVRHDPRVRWIHDDGRTWLRRTDATYDLITSEPPPARCAGVYRLYSVEYYEEALRRLRPRGTMTQWLPINELSREAELRIVASFAHVFPHALLFIGSGDQLVLLGGREPFDAPLLERRFVAATSARRDVEDLSLRTPLELLARVVCADDALRAVVRDVREIRDARNDLALLVTDPLDPPVVPRDPDGVLRALSAERLDCGAQLGEVLRDPQLFGRVVPDLPHVLAPRPPPRR